MRAGLSKHFKRYDAIKVFFICLKHDFRNHTRFDILGIPFQDTTSVANSITFLIILSLERFFSRAGATLHNVPREWAFLKGVTSVNWKMTGWEDKRQKGRSMTPCDVAVSRLNTRPREKGAYTSIKFGKVSVFSRRHEGAKRRIKDQFGRNVFSQQASMPNVFTTDQSPVRTLPAISSSRRSKNVASQF